MWAFRKALLAFAALVPAATAWDAPASSSRVLQRRATRRQWVALGAKAKAPAAIATAVPTASLPRGLGVILAGAPASGKGTQCVKLVKEFGLVHLSTGDLLRAAVAEESALGAEAKGFMDAGKLVPDQLVIDLVAERLCSDACRTKGWLLDGFPRTAAQATALAASGAVVDCFVALEVE